MSNFTSRSMTHVASSAIAWLFFQGKAELMLLTARKNHFTSLLLVFRVTRGRRPWVWWGSDQFLQCHLLTGRSLCKSRSFQVTPSPACAQVKSRKGALDPILPVVYMLPSWPSYLKSPISLMR